MAVPESSPPVRVARNTMRMVAQTVVQGEGNHRGVVGRFRHSSNRDILLAKETSIVLACPNEEGELVTQHTQPVHGTILDLKLVNAPQHAKPGQVREPCWCARVVSYCTSNLISNVAIIPAGDGQGRTLDVLWQLVCHPV